MTYFCAYILVYPVKTSKRGLTPYTPKSPNMIIVKKKGIAPFFIFFFDLEKHVQKAS